VVCGNAGDQPAGPVTLQRGEPDHEAPPQQQGGEAVKASPGM
jgi:hypothetical protein